ncbi:radical SAM protein [Paenarthrobacter sp. NPDC089316]|uniref:radical SAM/SPASM domain-containing protein n=1 Tax=unclassified Paenarthrobacter TaxID=2634190 RepID=UPI003415D23D
MRVSHYTTAINLTAERSLLMNHPRNILDFVSVRVAEAVRSGQLEQLSDDTRNRLFEKGYLTDEDSDTEIAWLSRKMDAIEAGLEGSGAVRSYCFITSYRCNLACSYCFQSNETARIVTNRMLTLDQARAGLAVMDADVASGRVDPEQTNPVLLFGGEPLLPNQRDVVELIVSECRRMGFKVSATTNGVFLHLFEELLGPDGISHMQVSLDGDAAAHDRRRIPVNGKPTFSGIWKNVVLALERGARVDLRANLDQRNLDSFADLVDFVAEEGYLEHPGLSLRYARVVPDFESADGHADVALAWSDIETRLTEQMASRPNLARVAAPSDIETFATWVREKYPQKASRHCGAVQGNTYFGPDNELYNCHETSGRVELSIGRYTDHGIVYNGRAQLWQGRRADHLSRCSKCPFVTTCAGGCAARVDLDGEPLASNCDNFANTFAESIRRVYLTDGAPNIHELAAASC